MLLRRSAITHVAAYTPRRRVTNEDFERDYGIDAEWIRTRTGIDSRALASPGELASTLAIKAASLLPKAVLRDVGCVLLTTSTADFLGPATAPVIASSLSLANVPAMDVEGACSGYLYGLQVAQALVAAGTYTKVLLCTAESSSLLVDPRDRDTGPIFGDAATATVLEEASGALGAEIVAQHLRSNGSDRDLVSIPGIGAKELRDGDGAPKRIVMDGRPLFLQAATRMYESTKEVLEGEGLSACDVDLVIPHQANQRITESLARLLGIPDEKTYSNISWRGNTISSSIPLAFADAARSGALSAPSRVLLTAFGGGTTWGSSLLSVSTVPEIHTEEE